MSQPIRKPKSIRLDHDSAFGAMKKTSLAMGISTAMLLPLAAGAADAAPAAKAEQQLPDVVVLGKRLDPNPNAEQGLSLIHI